MSRRRARRGLEESEMDPLASAADVMAGFVFVLLIVLAQYVLQVRKVEAALEEEQERFDERLKGVDGARNELQEYFVDKLTEKLEETDSVEGDEDRRVRINAQKSAVILPWNVVEFAKDAEAYLPRSKAAVDLIATTLLEVVSCYGVQTSAVSESSACKDLEGRKEYRLESVFVEGHTDGDTVAGKERANLDLSARRAAYTLKNGLFKSQKGELANLQNSDGVPLFAVAGYGAMRLERSPENNPKDKLANRRIELRFNLQPIGAEAE